jgi:molybdate transport system permease protein
MYRTSIGAFEQIDENIFNAARTLGISEWKIFWKLAVPLAWPGILAGSTLSFARSLGEFGATLMVAGNIPGKTETIPIAIYFAVESGENGRALILVTLIFILSLTVMFMSNFWTKKQNHISSTRRN